jgi:hypothetical protein
MYYFFIVDTGYCDQMHRLAHSLNKICKEQSLDVDDLEMLALPTSYTYIRFFMDCLDYAFEHDDIAVASGGQYSVEQWWEVAKTMNLYIELVKERG